MTPEEAKAFTNEWVEAWNTHDLERILGHFADDATFTSPVAATIVPESEGIVRGKDALRAYWGEGLRLIPDLRFEIQGVYVGVDTLVINYRNQRGSRVNEVLFVEGGMVVRGVATYLDEGTDPAGSVGVEPSDLGTPG